MRLSSNFRSILTGGSLSLFFAGSLLLFSSAVISAQVSPGNGGTVPPKDPPERKASDPSREAADIKVVFPDDSSGVLYVESGGKRYKIDTVSKVVSEVAQTKDEVERPAPKVQPETPKTVAQNEKEESMFDFDKGEEPFDYRLINVPTGKSVPKGTWNLSFSHRFSEPIHPISESSRDLLGFDSMSASSFGVTYGLTDRLYLTASRSPICQRGLCRTIEVGVGYNWLAQDKEHRLGLTTYASVEGNENFTEEYTYNVQAMISARVQKRVFVFFSPAAHFNSNGQRRFNPRPTDYFPPATAAVNAFKLPANGASYGFGTSVMITPTLLASFEFTPRTGFKLGQVQPIVDNNFRVIAFKNVSYPEMGFAIQKNIGRHSFVLTLTNTQTTTTSRYNSSNLVFKPGRLVLGFNLFRRF